MRAVVQRVSEARVSVGGGVVGEIGEGLLAYVAAGSGDDERDVAYLIRKVKGLRVFEDERGLMNRSIEEIKGSVLVISQFTLFGDCRRGLRPSFNDAMEPEGAERLVEAFRQGLEAVGVTTASGKFRAMMDVTSCNKGPVTILLDSKKTF